MNMSEGQEPESRSGSLSVLLRNVSEAQDIIVNFGKAAVHSSKPLKSSLENLFPEVGKLLPGTAEPVAMTDFRASYSDPSLIYTMRGLEDHQACLIGVPADALVAFANCAFGASRAAVESDGELVVGKGELAVGKCVAEIVLAELLPHFEGALAKRMPQVLQASPEYLDSPEVRDLDGVRVRFDLQLAHGKGVIDVFVSETCCQKADAAQAGVPRQAGLLALRREVQRTGVKLEVILQEEEMTLGEIANLQLGQVHELGFCLGQEVQVQVEGVKLFNGFLNQTEEHYVLKVSDFLKAEAVN
ncbi:MAG: FliM/FliN family flagellar motor switch protein [Anderseniella sp.]